MLTNLKKELGINNTGIFHKVMAEKLRAKIGYSNTIKRAEAIYLLSRHMKMECVNEFLIEMQNYGLIKLIDKQNIELLQK